MTVRLDGDDDNVKVGVACVTALMVRLMVVVLVRLPEVPVTVTVAVPVVALLLAESVRVLVPVVLLGLNEAVTPLGNPEADKLTLLLKPLDGVTVMVEVPLALWLTDRLEGDAESVKLGVGCVCAVGTRVMARILTLVLFGGVMLFTVFEVLSAKL